MIEARGEAACPPLMMFKLLLRRWYDLSDPAMEEAVAVSGTLKRFYRMGRTRYFTMVF